MSSKAAVLALLAATAGIAGAHCTPKTMETGRWDATLYVAPYCPHGAGVELPQVPYSNSLDYGECTPCASFDFDPGYELQSFALSAAKKSKISMSLFEGFDCDGKRVIERFNSNVARNTTNSKLRLAGSFHACRAKR
ncbi:hypothetical protein BV22DRAFT_1133927 [Leucogyrophana mollusca]|uniref:Uncharacterized protein n=1 Tax=Leucogyrophana mollusca TaxID=85980 RepID=A0ACB8B0V1_9AGAM|nr:hypothetical protein BV22DRAFT_1133927 [Leucogyrophana mollusca]